MTAGPDGDPGVAHIGDATPLYRSGGLIGGTGSRCSTRRGVTGIGFPEVLATPAREDPV